MQNAPPPERPYPPKASAVPNAPGLAEAAPSFLYPAVPLAFPAPADPVATPPDPALLAALGAANALRLGLLPWQRRGGETLILTPLPQEFDRHRDRLTALYGPDIRPLPCPRSQIESALLAHAGADLAHAAAHRPADADSCRSLDRRLLNTGLLGGLLTLGAALLLSPAITTTALILLALITLIILTLLKLVTTIATLAAGAAALSPPLAEDDLPTITMMIALYHEADIAPRLVRRLSALDYPRHRLDILLLVEDSDPATGAALRAADLPPWMRVLSVPPGQVQTKPRALNFGLDFARGDILGVYDAEDAPEPDQLRKVAAAFAAAPPQVACLQGMLDFYNPRTNWIARCFTMDYATWFRLVLPGLDHLGLPIPLGGTTLFLRRAVVASIGGWDAHNVTEDADLGLRLARHGWQTRILPSVTYEEANCRPVAWVRQRSRWTKGYLMTWFVHMRAPRRLWQDLGPRRFIATQVLLLGALVQVLLAPLLWSFWLIPFGLPHPASTVLPGWSGTIIAATFLISQALVTGLAVTALRRAGHRRLWPWVPMLAGYYLLATLAGVKAMVETILCPFHWDKTKHGQFDTHPDAGD